MAPAPESLGRAKAGRTIGMVMLGSAVALVVAATLTWVGFLPMGHGTRGWATAGMVVAAVFEAAVGLYFLRTSSEP